eukprot:jgi/Chlat1/2677/Chrsp18S02985
MEDDGGSNDNTDGEAGHATVVAAGTMTARRPVLGSGWKVPVAVIPGLYLSAVGAVRNITVLRKLNITHVVTVMVERKLKLPGCEHMVIPVLDAVSTRINEHFDAACKFIDEARLKGNILVHCYAGRSRSVTIVMAYLIKCQHMTLQDALASVRTVRHSAEPNPSFMLQLQEYEHNQKLEQALEQAR